MSNAPKKRPARPDAKAELKRRPAGELKFSLSIEVPEAEGGGQHQIDVDLMGMSLAERQLAPSSHTVRRAVKGEPGGPS